MGGVWNKVGFLSLAVMMLSQAAGAAVFSRLPGPQQVVALTFDACETSTPSFFDQKILAYLLREKIPCTIFLSGKFIRRNYQEIAALARQDFIEFENHSLTHCQHMERLSHDQVLKEVKANEDLVRGASGRKPVFFRFPAGNYDERTLAQVESMGYRVVHWSFASGDPNKKISGQRLSSWVLSQTRPGSILIFHINGRGYHTAEALPVIVQALRQKGYGFVRLDQVVAPARL